MTNFSALIEHWFEDASLQRVTPLHGGVSAEVHRVDLLLGNQTPFSLVVREHGSQHSGHPVAIEHALLSALVELGLPVPRVLFADTTGAFSNNPFLALDFIEGDTILVPEQLEPRIDQAATLLATIHQQSITSLPDLPQRVDPLPEIFEFWPGGKEWRPLKHFLESAVLPLYPSTLQLLHGDFWPGNLVWHNNQIRAAIDWEDAAIGDPMSDLAASRLEFRYLVGQSGMRAFTACYEQHQPIDWPRLALWQVYVAAAAQHYMGEWGLPKDRENHMRNVALTTIREAASSLLGQAPLPC